MLLHPWKTTQLLTKHAIFYYASITQFLWSSMLAFNYHAINSGHQHKLMGLSTLATEIIGFPKAHPTLPRPACTLPHRNWPALGLKIPFSMKCLTSARTAKAGPAWRWAHLATGQWENRNSGISGMRCAQTLMFRMANPTLHKDGPHNLVLNYPAWKQPLTVIPLKTITSIPKN